MIILLDNKIDYYIIVINPTNSPTNILRFTFQWFWKTLTETTVMLLQFVLILILFLINKAFIF